MESQYLIEKHQMKIYRSLIPITLIFIEFGCFSTKKNILKQTLASDNPNIKNVISTPEPF